MEAAVGSVIGATVEAVLQKLLSISGEEMDLSRNFKKDLENLRRSFLMIQNFLQDAERQEVTSGAVKLWLKKLESVAFEADNVIDDLILLVLHNNVIEIVHTFLLHQIMARRIQDINEELKLINYMARHFNLQVMKPVGAGSDLVASRETDPFTADSIFLGREEDVSNIVEMLTASPAAQGFSILPILGMGGLGKTTLARQVFNHEKIKAHFEIHIWVYVSRNFDATILFKKILESLTRKSIQFENRGVLLKELQEELSAKRYLLVLDDLWNESRVEWDDFLYSLAGISSVMGNSVIVTTRGENVASMVKTRPVYKLKGLSEDECWSVIKAKTFGEAEVPSELEMNGRKIANRCQGLPLAAKVVGGLLCDKSKEEWLAFERAWLSNFGEDENAILKVLKVNFDHLSSPSLKKCFAYCSIFPKGYTMDKEQLIQLWMAEGFLATDRSNDMETVGNKFFNLLINNSLLQVEKYHESETKCTMHDLVHDLASSILGSKSVNDLSLDDIYHFRYIGPESIRDGSLLMPEQHARCVRTLFFSGEVSDNLLLHFKSLHALVLMSRGVNELPSSITELIHLRLLDISDTSIRCLPDSISRLCHLQTLRGWGYVRRLPNTLKYLTCLRHLQMHYTELPPGIGRLTSLQTLPSFPVGHEKGVRIGELGSLKNLKGELAISNLEKVDDKEEAKSAYLIQKPNIVNLFFSWAVQREGETNDENVLEGLQPHPNLESLEIYGFKGRCFPLWTMKMEVRDALDGWPIGLNNLMEITLKECRECEEIPMLGHLPHLKSLSLHALINVSSMGLSFYGIGNFSTSSSSRVGKNNIFPALERLELVDMPNLIEWVEPEFPSAGETRRCEIVVFPRLEYLWISNCPNLRSAPSHFECLKELSILLMYSALPLENICRSSSFSLREIRIAAVDGVVCLPHALFCNTKNLTELRIEQCLDLTHLIPSLQGGGASLRVLEISDCPNLRELPDDLHSLHLLEELSITSCPNLRSIPYPSNGQSNQGFINLRTLKIETCEGLTHLPTELIVSCAPSLENLLLTGLSSLTNSPMLTRCLHKMPRLKELIILDVPIVTDFSTEIGPLHSLRSLLILPSSSHALNYTFLQEFLGNIFRQSLSLHSLSLHRMEHLDSLPNQLQYLTDLSRLHLEGLGIEALPEWLGNMSSLQWITLYDCQKLRRLPSKEAMERLTKLIGLHIKNCSLLDVQRWNEQTGDDSEWPKISHIPYVKVSDDARDESQKDSFPDPDSASTSKLKPAERLWCAERSRLEKSNRAYTSNVKVVKRYESEIREENTTQEDGTTKMSSNLGESTTISMMPKFMGAERDIPGTRSLQENLNLNNYFGLDPDKDDYLFSEMKKLQVDPKSISEYLVVTEIRTADELRRAFVLNLAEKDNLVLPKEPHCPNLLLLFLQRNNQLTYIPPSFFHQMPDLCFLDLSHTRIKSLPSSLFVLTKLQVLMLRGCVCLDSLPTDIKNLINMEVLDLLDAQLYDVPKQIGHLKQLRWLQLSFYGPDNESEYAHLPSDLVSDPSIISEVQSLQALSIVVHPEDHRWTKIAGDMTKDVSKLKELRYLQFYFPTVQVLEHFIGKSPSWQEQQLKKFKFVVGNDIKRIVSRVPGEVESKYNQHDQCLRFVNGDEIPQVVTTVLTRATAFYLDHHMEIQSLSEFRVFNLDKLEFCMLRECPKIQFIIKGDERSETAAFFPNLEHLGFHYLWELEGISDHPLPSGSFKVLKYLMIHTCPKLEFIGSHSMLGCLSNLEEFLIEDCESVKAIVRENKKVKNDVPLLPRLQKLALSYLPQLVTLGLGLRLSEDKINIQFCPKLILEPQIDKGKKKKLLGFIG